MASVNVALVFDVATVPGAAIDVAAIPGATVDVAATPGAAAVPGNAVEVGVSPCLFGLFVVLSLSVSLTAPVVSPVWVMKPV